MKKLIALAAAAMMLLSLFTACGKEPMIMTPKKPPPLR